MAEQEHPTMCDCAHCFMDCGCFTGIGWTPHCGPHPGGIRNVQRRTPPIVACGRYLHYNHFGVTHGPRCDKLAEGHLVNRSDPRFVRGKHTLICREHAEQAITRGMEIKGDWAFEPLPANLLYLRSGGHSKDIAKLWTYRMEPVCQP